MERLFTSEKDETSVGSDFLTLVVLLSGDVLYQTCKGPDVRGIEWEYETC